MNIEKTAFHILGCLIYQAFIFNPENRASKNSEG